MTCLHGRHTEPVLFRELTGDNWTLADYMTRGGYGQIRRILDGRMPAERIVAEVRAAGLRRRIPDGGQMGFHAESPCRADLSDLQCG